MTPTRGKSRLDEAFDKFVYGGFSQDEVSQVQERAQSLEQQVAEAIDRLRSITADREGKEALARALQEGLKDG